MKPVDEYQGLYYLSAGSGEQSDASKPVELTMMGHRDVMLTVSLTGLALLIAAVIIALAFCRCRRNRGLRQKLAGMTDGAVHTSVDTEAGADRSRCGKLHNSLTVGSDPRQSPSGNVPKSNVIKNRSLLAKTTSLTSSLSQATADAAATFTAPFSPTSKVADPSQQVNGTIAVKTPLISLKSVGNQLGSGKNYSNGMTSAATHGSMTNVAKPEQHPAMAFWQAKSTSLLDMYIDTSEPTDTVGQIHFSLEYDFTTSTLILKIIQGKDLPAKDLSGTSDPYVRVTLLPDKKHRLETKIKRRTLNPKWNETFYFEGFPIQKLQNRVLHLHVFDYDRFSRDDSIGEVFMPLCQVDLSEKPVFWKGLRPLEKDKCGELLISLCYHPTQSQLTLVVLKARNLKAKDFNGKSDPYVKIWLHFGEKRVEKRKTPVFKNTLNPVFNETFAFEVPWERIREASLNVQVMDFDSVGRNELIGRLVVAGKNATGASEGKHWSDMISKPRQSVLQWHRLKPE